MLLFKVGLLKILVFSDLNASGGFIMIVGENEACRLTTL